MACFHIPSVVCDQCRPYRPAVGWIQEWARQANQSPLPLPGKICHPHCYCGESPRGLSMKMHEVCCKCGDQRLKGAS